VDNGAALRESYHSDRNTGYSQPVKKRSRNEQLLELYGGHANDKFSVAFDLLKVGFPSQMYFLPFATSSIVGSFLDEQEECSAIVNEVIV